MRHKLRIGFIGLLLASLAPSVALAQAKAPSRPCKAPAIRALAEGIACAEARNGIALGDPSAIPGLAPIIDDAAQRFTRHFGPVAAPAAVVAITSLSAEQSETLARHGFAVLPWISASMRREIQEKTVRESLRSRFANLPKAQQDAVMASALAQVRQSGASDKEQAAKESGSLAHELAHLWFKRLYDGAPNKAPQAKRYGSTGPDWLDEMAAVLAENDTITQLRRKGLKASRSGQAKLIPLSQYFSMVHPVLAAAIETMDERPGNGPRMRVLTGEDAMRVLAKSNDAEAFYNQSRGFADFMIERTRNPRIFHEIALHVRGGGSMESWLAAHGARYGLGASLPALETDWGKWLAS